MSLQPAWTRMQIEHFNERMDKCEKEVADNIGNMQAQVLELREQLTTCGAALFRAGGSSSDIGEMHMVDTMTTVAVAGQPRTSLISVPSSPPQYYLRLVCYECQTVHQTQNNLHSSETYADAVTDGWGKPSTKSWIHIRCPACKDWHV